jgi:hypothetical protein
MMLSDEDLRDIERGAPSGLLDSYSGILVLLATGAIVLVTALRHFS